VAVAELGAEDRAPLDDQPAALRAVRDPQLVIVAAAADERDRTALNRGVALDPRRAELGDLRLAPGRDVQAVDVTATGVDRDGCAVAVGPEIDVEGRAAARRDSDRHRRPAADGLHQGVARRGCIEVRPHDRAVPGRDARRSRLSKECRRRGLRRGRRREHDSRDGDGDE